MIVSGIGGPKYRSPNIVILIVATPIIVPLIWGKKENNVFRFWPLGFEGFKAEGCKEISVQNIVKVQVLGFRIYSLRFRVGSYVWVLLHAFCTTSGGLGTVEANLGLVRLS